jgi:hypothetical protein
MRREKAEEEYLKMNQILAMLDPEEHRLYLETEIEKIENELKTAESKIRIEYLESMLLNLKELLEKLDNNFA